MCCLQDQGVFEQRAKELRAKQDRIEELQRTLQAVSREREDLTRLIETKDQLLQSQSTQIAQLTAARDKLHDQVTQLEAALQDVDTKKQMGLLRTQYEQVGSKG